ncbi:MAG: hypothetical protein KJO84_09705 [Acidimicrobiia bacterium]|nr:hypothetical protein [Acidimicrobiia bacterium]
MKVTEFTDEYELAAPLFDSTAAELRARTLPPGSRRWLAVDDGIAVAAATSMVRPDDRVFLRFVGDAEAYGPLADGVIATLGRRVHAFTRSEEMLAALERAGFGIENVTEDFAVPFDRALALTSRAWLPSGYSLHRADEVDEDRLFALDNMLRRDVPGSDGWRGNREWFHDELHGDPAFDPSAYLVAQEENSGEYVGLTRIWRNDSGPRLGLIGVRRHHRGSTLAPFMLHRALESAATWGSEVFHTGTSLSNRAVYPKLSRIGESQGLSWQLVRE